MSENARGGSARTTSAAYIFGSDAARTHQGPARREALERGLRAEFAALERLDTEIRERLAHELRHGYFVAHVHKASLARLRSTLAVAVAPYGHNCANAKASSSVLVTH